MPLGGNPKVSSFWDPVVEKIDKKLSSWRFSYLSKGGRLTLAKAVLSNLPTYFLSTFKAPMKVTHEEFSMGRYGKICWCSFC